MDLARRWRRCPSPLLRHWPLALLGLLCLTGSCGGLRLGSGDEEEDTKASEGHASWPMQDALQQLASAQSARSMLEGGGGSSIFGGATYAMQQQKDAMMQAMEGSNAAAFAQQAIANANQASERAGAFASQVMGGFKTGAMDEGSALLIKQQEQMQSAADAERVAAAQVQMMANQQQTAAAMNMRDAQQAYLRTQDTNGIVNTLQSMGLSETAASMQGILRSKPFESNSYAAAPLTGGWALMANPLGTMGFKSSSSSSSSLMQSQDVASGEKAAAGPRKGEPRKGAKTGKNESAA
eukprot:TRINITY_DN7338_c0_g1_i1.p1 TRINITY_DN7338_c0_g1~~TRINITY_DN7338_c0_g1_i1.p1  ORF type:complete len:295 (-),score=104.42 TRINITY_DN7338_c0_g1_i1:184-1068(-)